MAITRKSAASNRGKEAEGKVKDILKKIESRCMHFTYNRCPDAHAAGGKFTPQAGDFQAFIAGTLHLVALPSGGVDALWTPGSREGVTKSRNIIIEVKEVNHKFRLSHGNYSEDKVARVDKRVRAGTEVVVAVMHKDGAARTWRLVPHHVFNERTGGSWDLSAWPLVEIEPALRAFIGVAA